MHDAAAVVALIYLLSIGLRFPRLVGVFMSVEILVLGSTGMLGTEMVRVLRSHGLNVTTAGRLGAEIPLDAELPDFRLPRLVGFKYIINCVGMTKHNINTADFNSLKSAKAINTEFPRKLAEFAEEAGSKVIQIATDCVFSGTTGRYIETSSHDAVDIYGITKSAGEVLSESVMHLRCSTLGKGGGGHKQLLQWVLGHGDNAKVSGYTNHIWNGVSTTAFAHVVAGVIEMGTFKHGVKHLVPANSMSKFELVKEIAAAFGRGDLEVVPVESPTAKDMSLSTVHPEFNTSLWAGSDYRKSPTIQSLVYEMANLDATLD
jgi:dTDP-4-dehydrorhamnose reductase